MVDMGSVLVVIPARGGSKRLPRKNVLPLSGKPLICWTIEAAVNANLSARIIVSSDDEEVLTIARSYESHGIITHHRPDILATDTASTIDVLIDAVKLERSRGLSPKTIVLLQPTSPLRVSEDIQCALKLYMSAKSMCSVVTVCKVEHPSDWVGTIAGDGCIVGMNLTKKYSQDDQVEYRLNGAVYVIPVEVLMNNKTIFSEKLFASVMPRERSLDIDEEIDLAFCESILKGL